MQFVTSLEFGSRTADGNLTSELAEANTCARRLLYPGSLARGHSMQATNAHDMPSRFAPRRKLRASDALRKRLGYDILFDAGTPEQLLRFFQYAGGAIPSAFGLSERAKDEAIVSVAQTNSRMIVTHDKRMDDYVRAHQAGRKLHRCLNGLVLLPSGYAKQQSRLQAVARRERVLEYETIEIFWFDAWAYNFFVDIRDASWPIVTPLCACGLEQFRRDLRKRKLL